MVDEANCELIGRRRQGSSASADASKAAPRLLSHIRIASTVMHQPQILIMEDEASSSDVFIPPSVLEHQVELVSGRSYAHYSEVPETITTRKATST